MGKTLVPARALRSAELVPLLASLGASGEAGRARLQAVVALLTGTPRTHALAGGAFADGPRHVTDPFTTGLHNCLRGASVNEAQRDATKIR